MGLGNNIGIGMEGLTISYVMKCAPMPSLYAPSWNSLDFSFACLAFFAQCCHGNGSGVRHVHHSHSLYNKATVIVIVAMAMVVMGDVCSKYHGRTHYYQDTMLFVIVIYCCHGDGGDGRHVCTKYHGHMY